jgi:hypothetical protein
MLSGKAQSIRIRLGQASSYRVKRTSSYLHAIGFVTLTPPRNTSSRSLEEASHVLAVDDWEKTTNRDTILLFKRVSR